jgi:hypothetical protein
MMCQYCCCTSHHISLESGSCPSSKHTIFCDVTPCSPVEVHRRFRGTYCIHLQGSSVPTFLYKTPLFRLILLYLSSFTSFMLFDFRYAIRSAYRVVGIATGYGLDDRGVGVRVPVGSRIFSSPHRPHQLWGPPNLLSNGYRGLIRRGKAARA